jgi:hypothetical protein
MSRSEWKRRLAVWGGAIAVSAASFGLILWMAAWLPYVLFRWWLHLSPRVRAMATPLPVFVVAMVSIGIGFALGLRTRRAQRWTAAQGRRAH